jgi:hypothetical protein
MIKCDQCGSCHIEEGRLEGMGAVGFHPTNIRFLTLKTKIAVKAWVCVDCGRLRTGCDPDDLKAIVRSDETPLPG